MTKTLPGGGIVDDRRTPEERAQTVGFIVATDTVMSGWGRAPGRSIFALPVTLAEYLDGRTVRRIMERMEARPDMSRVRECGRDWRPRLRAGDHLSIRSIAETASWRE